MIPVGELEKIAYARIGDAKVLLSAGRFDGAMYLCGYAVEVALKARMCRALNWQGFPETSGEFHNYASLRTHDLDVLLRLSGQEERIKSVLFEEWNVVAVWRVGSRYSIVGTVTPGAATAMINAAEKLLKEL